MPGLALLLLLSWGHAFSPAISAAETAVSTSTLEGVPARERELILEMRDRRILSPKQTRYGPQERATLLRVREAEALGALAFLRGKLGSLRGLAAERRGGGSKKTCLTAEGYAKYVFLKSQDARAYFEGKGTPAYMVFRIRDSRERPLFDAGGMLTREGDAIYDRIRRDLPVFWKHPDGQVNGNVRPPKDAGQASPQSEPQLTQDQREAQAERRVLELVNGGYVQLSEPEYRHLLQAPEARKGPPQESPIQVIETSRKVYYLISPSDPLMAVVARYRAGNK